MVLYRALLECLTFSVLLYGAAEPLYNGRLKRSRNDADDDDDDALIATAFHRQASYRLNLVD